MQQARAGWKSHHALGYRRSKIINNTDVKDSLPFIYCTSYGLIVGLTRLEDNNSSESEEEKKNLKTDYEDDSDANM